MSGVKVIFVELDGGTWEIIESLFMEGKLPNLKNLMENGVHGELLSDHPFISAKLWTSMFTGKTASKHGIQFFGAKSQNILCKRIWDILEEKKLTVGTFGSLVTWPPRSINGFMIPSVFALGPETYPEKYQFYQEIVLGERKGLHHLKKNTLLSNLSFVYHLLVNGIGARTVGKIISYLTREKILRYGHGDRYWQKATLQLMVSADIFLKLHKKYSPNFSTFHIHLCDAVSHRYWEFFQPEKFPRVDSNGIKKFAKVIPASYIESDKLIGKILSLRDEKTIFIVASDHGFMALPKPPINPYIINLDTFLKALEIDRQVIPARFGLETFLYFNDNLLKEKSVKVIKKIKFWDTQENLFEVRSVEGYVSFKIAQNRWKTRTQDDTIIDLQSFGKLKFNELFSQKNVNISGIHKREGILIMQGPAIQRGERIQNPTIFDLTPTVLYLMGFPVAKDMDGKVLKEAIQERFIKQNKIEFIDSYEEGSEKEAVDMSQNADTNYDKVKERLQQLGYL